jgi:hypothetical protein
MTPRLDSTVLDLFVELAPRLELRPLLIRALEMSAFYTCQPATPAERASMRERGSHILAGGLPDDLQQWFKLALENVLIESDHNPADKAEHPAPAGEE